jgi:uncharacterized membrane protein SpoIIM required for sporulation
MALTPVAEESFVARRRADWTELEGLLAALRQRGEKKLPARELARLPLLYRDVCADLARAEAARYGAPLVAYLQGLTATAHGALYARPARAAVLPRLRSAAVAFPRAFRARPVAMALAFALFFGPFFFGLLAALHEPAFAFRIVPEAQLRPLSEAYAQGFDAGRAAGEDAMMAGFYVDNNVGIALRCFALGIFGGLGSAFFLVQNGLSIGAILGYVASQGAGANIVTFVVGHGTLELGAVVIAGGAGLSLGWSVVAPGERTRLASLQAEARHVLVLVLGASVMLFMAAAIEAFWSASSVPSTVKRAVGVLLFCVVVSYLGFAGRREERS